MTKRSEHRQTSGCPVACALDIFGDHWTLIIIRNLMFRGVHEYKDMLKLEENISTNILSNRLKILEDEGLIASIPHRTNQKRKIYYLTERGKSLVHVMVSIILWSRENLAEFLEPLEEGANHSGMNPKALAKRALARLEAWEKEHLS